MDRLEHSASSRNAPIALSLFSASHFLISSMIVLIYLKYNYKEIFKMTEKARHRTSAGSDEKDERNYQQQSLADLK